MGVVPRLFRNVAQGCKTADTGIDVEHVDPAICILDGLHHRFRRRRIGDVGTVARSARHIVDCSVYRGLIAPGQVDLRPFRGKGFRRGQAHSRIAAQDQYDLVRETHGLLLRRGTAG